MASPKVIRSGDWDINYSQQGSGPPLVLLHGGSPGASGLRNFHGNVEALSKHFTTFVIDFPGWGASSKNLLPIGAWGDPLEAGGAAVIEFMDAVGLARAHLMGSSFGASAALHAAMSSPERVDRLVLMSPGGGIPAPGKATPALGKLFGYYAGDGPTWAKFESLSQHLVHDKSLIARDWLEPRYEASLDRAVIANPPLRLPPGFVPEPSQALCNDVRLKELRAPTLFIWGRDDEVQPVSCLDSFASIPEQDAVVLGHCGHLPYWEQASKVNDVAAWFLRRK